jgi:hypothetical protein
MIASIGALLLAFLAGKQLTPKEYSQVEEWYAARIGGTSSGAIQGSGAFGGDIQSIAYDGKIYIDPTVAAGGTVYPYGTREHPCKTYLEARTIAAARGLNTFFLIGDCGALDADMQNCTFINDIPFGDAALDRNGQSIDGSLFINVSVYGTAHLAAADYMLGIGSTMGDTINPIGLSLIDCSLGNANTFNMTGGSAISNCWAGFGTGAILDYTGFGAGGESMVNNWRGGRLEIANLTGGALYISGHGDLVIDATCAGGGDIYVDHNMRVTNNAGVGCTVHDYSNRTSLDTLLARITAARAGYFDELAAANLPADIDGLKTSRDRTRCTHIPQWGACTEEIQLTDGATDTAFPQIVVSKLPAGATPTCVYLGIKYGAIENTAAGVNKVNGAQKIQIKKGAGAWVDAINIPDDYLTLAATTREGGDIIWGNIDIAAAVTGNDTYTIQWDEALVDADFMLLNNVQTVLYIEYSI